MRAQPRGASTRFLTLASQATLCNCRRESEDELALHLHSCVVNRKVKRTNDGFKGLAGDQVMSGLRLSLNYLAKCRELPKNVDVRICNIKKGEEEKRLRPK